MSVPVEKAMQLIQAAHGEAESIDLAITVVVVDEGGRLVALGRMDTARPVSVDIATNKAYTAASFQQPTSELSSVAGQAWFQSLVVSSGGRVMAGGGGVPIKENGVTVGAIGVSGGTDEQDHRLCEVALQRFG